MRFNMKKIYKNWDFEITGISTIDNPKNNTFIHVPEKDYDKLEKLKNIQYSVVFTGNGAPINKSVTSYNFFLLSDDSFAEYTKMMEAAKDDERR